MCGIIGGIGNTDFRSFLLTGLTKLDYRGYDSAGVAYFEGDKIEIRKVCGRVAALSLLVPQTLHTKVGIGHSRWATHGRPSVVNAHPHASQSGMFAIVHNGVITNFKTLQNQLKARRFQFVSQTDSEVIPHLLEWYYTRSGSVMEALRLAAEELQGSYAVAILCKDDPNHLYYLKKGAPLLICKTQDGIFISSDPTPLAELGGDFYDLPEGSYGYLGEQEVVCYCGETPTAPTPFPYSGVAQSNELHGYRYHMEKEIADIPYAIAALSDNYLSNGALCFDENLLSALSGAKRIHFLGCGSSFFACQCGVSAFRARGKEALASVASEWLGFPYDLDGTTFFILVSQSGETADLIRCQAILNEKAIPHLTITNTKMSSLERKSTYSLLLYAGLETAVAATKTFVSEVVLLELLASALGGAALTEADLNCLIEGANAVLGRRNDIEHLLSAFGENTFCLATGRLLPIAREAALKLKEVGYLHAEALASGEMKHGPLALIGEGFPVLALVGEICGQEGLRASLEEIKTRGGVPLVISMASYAQDEDAFVLPNVPAPLVPSLFAIVVDLFAFVLGQSRNHPVDHPRNLAKSVTV